MLKLKEMIIPSLKNVKNFQKIRCYTSRIVVRSHIKNAILKKQPVVALESTIITHGMTYPYNINTALEVEKIIANHNVLPATIGVIHGQLIVGLTSDEMRYLAMEKTKSIKISRRDISYALSKDCNGGTTVSATMLASHWAGISLFVTGGIGGVHRGASETFDISADLQELGRTPVAVVCAGIKSILDIGLTLEYLETQGVPVITYGSRTYFPSFFTPASKFQTQYNLQSPEEVAEMINCQFSMNLQNGMVIGVPIPDEHAANNIEEKIEEALMKTRELQISGKDVTPFVLDYISTSSKGESLKANIALIKNNAEVGAKIANSLSQFRRRDDSEKCFLTSNIFKLGDDKGKGKKSKRPVVVGGSVFDIKATTDKYDCVAESTNAGQIHLGVGGVGRNIAECLFRLDCDPFLISSVGDDYQGEMILNEFRKLNMDISGICVRSQQRTASYSIMAGYDGELKMAVGDMEMNDRISKEQVLKHREQLLSGSMIIVDANIPEETIKYIVEFSNENKILVWFEPTCFTKATKPFLNNTSPSSITIASPNYVELKAIHRAITGIVDDVDDLDVSNLSRTQIIEECLSLIEPCLVRIDNLLITLGKHGVLVVQKKPSILQHDAKVVFYPPVREDLIPVNVKSVSGAGDSFAAGMIFGIHQNYDMDSSVKAGLYAAYTSLQSYAAINNTISKELFSLENIQKWASFNSTIIQH